MLTVIATVLSIAFALGAVLTLAACALFRFKPTPKPPRIVCALGEASGFPVRVGDAQAFKRYVAHWADAPSRYNVFAEGRKTQRAEFAARIRDLERLGLAPYCNPYCDSYVSRIQLETAWQELRHAADMT